MAKPMPWEWARSRVLPLLAGPCFDPPSAGLVRAQSQLGCAVEFRVAAGQGFVAVEDDTAERWECSPAQLLQTALANLRARLAPLGPRDVGGGAFSGRIIRRLTLPPRCAASTVLLPDELVRLFGTHDQVFAAPEQDVLVSFSIDVPQHVMADAIVDMEMAAPLPLMYDPFVLVDGQLIWQPSDDDRYAEEPDC